jgi:hypothetical protein
MIIQGVKPILQQLVNQTGHEAGTLTIDWVSLVPVLVNAIQKQQDALSRKDADIDALNARLTALIQLMERLTGPQVAKLQKWNAEESRFCSGDEQTREDICRTLET